MRGSSRPAEGVMTATGRRKGSARSRALLALVLGTSAVAAAPAAAAPPWSVPATLPVSARGFFPTGFVGSASGTALLHGTTSSRPSTYTDALVWLGPDGTILHEQVLSRRLAAAPLEVTA